MEIKMKLMNIVLIVSFFILGACGIRDHSTVQASKDFYFTHVNRPVELNLEHSEKLKDSERALSLKFAKLDRELTSLARVMDGILDPTNQAAVGALVNQFPWVSNAYVLDADNAILGAIPSVAPGTVNFDYLSEKEILARELYGHVLVSGDNTLILLARPYIQSGNLVGYLAVSFDSKALLPLVGDASHVFMRTIDDVLWTGDTYLSETPAAGTDWKTTLDKKSSGSFSSNGQTATWFTRYFAGLSFIFGLIEPQS